VEILLLATHLLAWYDFARVSGFVEPCRKDKKDDNLFIIASGSCISFSAVVSLKRSPSFLEKQGTF